MTYIRPRPERPHASPERVKAAWAKRQLVWRHNSYLGLATSMRKQALTIANAPTTTDLSKQLAFEIEDLALRLTVALRTRKDPIE